MKNTKLFVVFSAIHLIFFLSILCIGTIYLTLGVLAIPSVTAAFRIGRDLIYREFDIYDGLVERFFRELKKELHMLRYMPLELLLILQLVGNMAAQRTGMMFLQYILVASTAFILTFLVYIIAFHIFLSERPKIFDVLIVMFYKIRYMMIIYFLMVLGICLISIQILFAFLFMGAILFLAVEVVAFLDIMCYKRICGTISENEEKWIHFL